MPRRRPEFGPGAAGAEADKLEKFIDAGGSQILWLPDAGKTDFRITSGIRPSNPLQGEKPLNQTIDYYNQNAKQYIERTQNFDVSYLFNAFITRLPQGAKVLDAGCGSGRDSLAFQKLGFDVLAIDAAEEFIKHVAELGITAKKMWMEEIDFKEEFDGVWCCASLVHVQKELLPDVITRIYKALKKGGIAFFSFKMGAGEGEESGRYFHYVDEERLLSYLANYEILDRLNNSSDKNQTPTSWISVIVKKP